MITMTRDQALAEARAAGREAVRQGCRAGTEEAARQLFDEMELAYGCWDDVLAVLTEDEAREAYVEGVMDAMQELAGGES